MRTTVLELLGVLCLSMPLAFAWWPLAFIPLGVYLLVAGFQQGGES